MEQQEPFDPYVYPGYIKLNQAIEAFTTDLVAQDPETFRHRGADVRYAVERQLFFALFADQTLHQYFVALQTNAPPMPIEDMPIWPRLIAPYMGYEAPSRTPITQSVIWKVIRRFHRMHGSATVTVHCDEAPEVLFCAIHRKFVAYLSPIAARLTRPFAYLVVDDPELYQSFVEEGLPCVHIQLDAKTHRLMGAAVRVLPGFRPYNPPIFDAWILRLNAIRNAIAALQPHCIVVPEGNAPIYEILNQASKMLGVRVVCIQQGWAPVVHPGFRNMSYHLMSVWGRGFKDILQPYNPKQNFIVTGNHCVKRREQRVSGAAGCIAFFLQNGAHWLNAVTLRRILELANWCARTFPHIEVRIRNHPGTPLSVDDAALVRGHANLKLTPPTNDLLQDVLDRCDVAVSINSTTILEAVAAGAVPVILDVCGWGPYQPDIASRGAAIEVRNFEEAKVAIRSLLEDEPYRRSFTPALKQVTEDFFANDGAAAAGAIASTIESAASA